MAAPVLLLVVVLYVDIVFPGTSMMIVDGVLSLNAIFYFSRQTILNICLKV